MAEALYLLGSMKSLWLSLGEVKEGGRPGGRKGADGEV